MFKKELFCPLQSLLFLSLKSISYNVCTSLLKHLWKFAVLYKCYYMPFTLFSKELVNTFKEHRWQMLTSLHHGSLSPINIFSLLTNFDPEEAISSSANFKDFSEETWSIVLPGSTSSLASSKYSNNFSWFSSIKTAPTPL